MTAFKAGDTVVYATHGLALIKRIEAKLVGSKRREFYITETKDSGLTIMVPVDAADMIRKPLDRIEAENLLKTLNDPIESGIELTWNRRYREFMERIKTGMLHEIALVYRSLRTLKESRDLSFGERKMLDETKHLLAAELSHSLNRSVAL